MKNCQKVMLRGKVKREMALLSEGSSVKEIPEDKQASAPCVKGSTLMYIFCKIRAPFLGPPWTILTVVSGTHFS